MRRTLPCVAIVSALFLVACAGTRATSPPPVPRHPLTRWHKVFRGGTPWRLTAKGVEIKGIGLPRTPGKPKTVSWIWETYHDAIDRWSRHYGVPAELVIAVIATEAVPARGSPAFTRSPESLRRESGFVSVARTPHLLAAGLMQTTIATARAVMERDGVPARRIDDRWLFNPGNAIRAGTAYLARQARGEMCNLATMFDPPVAIAAYHAGGVYRMGGRKNLWKMRQFPPRTGRHLDRAIAYFNDAVAALEHHSLQPGFGYRRYVYHPPAWPRRG